MYQILIAASVALVLTQTGVAQMKTFVVSELGGKNFAQFVSKAPIENIIGRTSQISGTVSFDPNDLSKGIKADIKVDLRTVDTGIEMRNQHMRSKDYLDTDQYPFAEFKLDLPLKGKLEKGKPREVEFDGTFTVHGVSKPVRVKGMASYWGTIPELEPMGYKGEIINFDGGFRFKLGDFNIQRPQMLFLKLAEEQDVLVNFTALTEG